MSSDIAIEFRGISKNYSMSQSPWRHMCAVLFGREGHLKNNTYSALADVSFTLKKGETLGIIGRNGAGKSTLLQILCGVLQATSGHVSVQGRIAALLELGAGFNPEFTGRENIFLSAAVYGLTHEQILARLDQIIEFAEIGEFIDQPVKNYSSGMFVRLAFSVIAHVDANILIIDEALAVGDFAFTQKCMRFLERFRSSGTLVFVSHDTHSIVKLCDKALWLESGKLKAFGRARDVSDAYLASFYEDKLNTSELSSGALISSEPQIKSFGLGGGKVKSIRFYDDQHKDIIILDRAQKVSVVVEVCMLQPINKPIVGFYFKDRLGQPLFGENTIDVLPGWIDMQPGASAEIAFYFEMPLLATGEYSLSVSLAEGTQNNHVQHHWIHDAITFKSLAKPHLTGLVQLENLQCILNLQENDAVSKDHE